jgi:hypothetical protein
LMYLKQELFISYFIITMILPNLLDINSIQYKFIYIFFLYHLLLTALTCVVVIIVVIQMI